MQRFALVILLFASACSRGGEPEPAASGEAIQCAVGKAMNFTPVCRLERAKDKTGEVLVVRHPDGGFRRLSVLPQGKGLASADGADVASQELAGQLLEVRVGEDRYRFPIVAKLPDGTR